MPIDSPVAVFAGNAPFMTTVTRSDVPLSASVTERRSAYAGVPRPASPAPSAIVTTVENGAAGAGAVLRPGAEPGGPEGGAGPVGVVPGAGVAEPPPAGLADPEAG